MELLGRMHFGTYADGGAAGTRGPGQCAGEASPPRAAGPVDAGAGMDLGRPVARRARCAEDGGGRAPGALAGDAAGSQRATGDARVEPAMELPGDAVGVPRSRSADAGNAAP